VGSQASVGRGLETSLRSSEGLERSLRSSELSESKQQLRNGSFPVVRGWVHITGVSEEKVLQDLPPEVQKILATVWPDYVSEGLSGSKVPAKEEICQEVLDPVEEEGDLPEGDDLGEVEQD